MGFSSAEALQAKIDLFKATGRLYREHEELFTETGWLQVLLGQHVTPERYHPLADGLGEDQLAGFLGDIKTLIDRAAAAAPPHADYIKQNCSAA